MIFAKRLLTGEASGIAKILEEVRGVFASVLETWVTKGQVGASVPIPEVVSTKKEKKPSIPVQGAVSTKKVIEPAPILMSEFLATEPGMEPLVSVLGIAVAKQEVEPLVPISETVATEQEVAPRSRFGDSY